MPVLLLTSHAQCKKIALTSIKATKVIRDGRIKNCTNKRDRDNHKQTRSIPTHFFIETLLLENKVLVHLVCS